VKLNDTDIEDTFAEAFPMSAARIVITAESPGWALTAAQSATGYACSVIGCDLEAAIERWLPPTETPDGRPGVAILAFGFDRPSMEQALIRRIGQCVLTCATTACYNGLPLVPGKNLKIGGNLRYFGDGWQQSKLLDGQRYWRIPTMDGEFVCEDLFGTTKGVAGGNFLLLARTQKDGLYAAEHAVDAIRKVPGVIVPFPGGIVRSGSKIGSRYKKLKASTNEEYCPTLRGAVTSALPDGVNAVYEIVIDGLDRPAVEAAMVAGIRAAAAVPGIVKVTAGNYGGKLGPVHLRLRELLR
jgi:formylmethanofuran--tetrahydromethanopterin N-formyltransferase